MSGRLEMRAKRAKLAQITDKIYVLESTSGLHDKCRQQGKFNGYGFGQTHDQNTCYNSHKEVLHDVEAWIATHESMGLAQMLCYYNLGDGVEDCPYYQKFLNLK